MGPKRKTPKGMITPLSPGQILTDLRKKQWRLGPLIGQGGFGYLYLGSDKSDTDVTDAAKYVIKVEPHSNGPLFVELAFYQRAAKEDTIQAWKKSKKMSHLGVPRYIGSGLFENSGTKYRFMIMDRFGQDVEKIFLESKGRFSLRTVFTLGLRIIEALEYLHEQDYVHADIKSSNLMTGFGEKNSNMVFLLDYGLAYRYCPSGQHVAYKEDPKRKHDGTVEYTSRDAHKGLAPSRRGDLEILSYCMLQWLCGKLPWENKLNDKDYVMSEKTRFMNNISHSLRTCLGASNVPTKFEDFFKYVAKLDYIEKPDYEKVKRWFRDALKEAGTSDDGKSVLFVGAATVKKGKAKVDGLVNGESRKRQSVEIDDATDEESSCKRAKVSASKLRKKTPIKKPPIKKSPIKKSPIKKSPVKQSPVKRSPVKQSPVKQVKRGPPRKRFSDSSLKKGVSPKAASARSKASLATTEQTTRKVRPNRGVKTADFAQSP